MRRQGQTEEQLGRRVENDGNRTKLDELLRTENT